MTIRYPHDIVQSFNTYIQISRHTFRGYKLDKLHDPKNFDYETTLNSIIALPVPNNISDTTNAEYLAETDFNIIRDKFAGVAKMFTGESMYNQAAGRTGMKVAAQAAIIFNSVGLKSHVFNWELVPSSAKEASDIEEMIDSFKMGMLPSIEHNNFFQLPDIWKVEIVGANSLFKYIPMFVTNVEVQGAPTGHFQTYQDGKMVVYNFTVTMMEITNRTQQIEKSLGNRTNTTPGR